MPRKSYKPEKIVAKLRQVDVLTSQGQSVAEATSDDEILDWVSGQRKRPTTRSGPARWAPTRWRSSTPSFALSVSRGCGSPYAVAAIKLLVFTGARLGEVLGLRWEWIDFERGEARLPHLRRSPEGPSGPFRRSVLPMPRSAQHGAVAAAPADLCAGRRLAARPRLCRQACRFDHRDRQPDQWHEAVPRRHPRACHEARPQS